MKSSVSLVRCHQVIVNLSYGKGKPEYSIRLSSPGGKLM